MTRRWRVCVGFVLITLTTLCALAASPKRVLILNPFGQHVAPFSVAASAFRTTLAQELGERVDFYEVSLDRAHFGESEAEDPFVEFLESRIANRPMDLVATVGIPGVRFVSRHRERLFPATPVVFMAGALDADSVGSSWTNTAFVTHSVSLSGMVEDILQLQPQTTNIVVIFGASALETLWMNESRRAFQPFTNRVGFIWVNELSFDRVLERCSTLPPHSFILHALFLVDAAGIPFERNEALRRLHEAANAPVFGWFASELGLGIIGGRLHQDSEVGSQGARAAIRILRGEKPQDIPPKAIEPTTPVFDWRELQRWGIDETRLPPGSVLQFREPTAWERYKGRIIAATALCLVEALLIFVLLANLIQRRRAERSLAETESRFRNAADAAPVMIWMSGRDKLCTFFNRPWLEFTGRALEQELGNGWFEGVHPDDLQDCLQTHLKAFDSRQPFVMDYRLRRRDGEYRWISDRGKPRHDSLGNFAGYIGSCLDVTESRREAEALSESESRLRAILDTAVEGIITLNERGTIESVNAATEKLFGYLPDEMVGQNVNLLMPSAFREEHDPSPAHSQRNHLPKIIGPGREVDGRRKDGSEFPIDLAVSEIVLADRRILTGFVRDITERKQAEQTAREFGGRLLHAQEAERARLARELHDDITQRLARLAIDAGLAESGRDGAGRSESMRELRDGLVRLSEDVHSLSYRLHPALLEDLGLADALKAECERFSRQESISVVVKVETLPAGIPPDTGICLFRVTQEGLRNVARHARANAAEVSLRPLDGGLQLAVTDTGVGFDPNQQRRRPSLGLASMRERVRLLDGELDLDSMPGHGTTIVAWVPLNGGKV